MKSKVDGIAALITEPTSLLKVPTSHWRNFWRNGAKIVLENKHGHSGLFEGEKFLNFFLHVT